MRIVFITLLLLLVTAVSKADSPRRGGVLKQLQTRPATRLDLYNQLSTEERSIRQHQWLMDKRYFRYLSMPVRAYLLKRYAPTQLQTVPQQLDSSPENIRVNDPALDGADRTQSGTTAVAAGDRLAISFNNSAGIVNNNVSGYAYSRDGGKSWKQGFIPTYPDGANLGSGVLAIAPDGSFLHACVAQDKNGIVSIAVSRSRDGGQSWSRPVNASLSATGQNVFHDKPWIAADRSSDSFNSNRVFVVWTSILQNSGKTRIQLARSKDGREFKKAQIIAESPQGSFVQAPTVAVGPRGEVYIVWLEGEFGRSQLKLAKSVDGGKTFGGPTVIAGFVNPAFPANGIFDANSFPSLAVDTSRRASRGHVYVAYAARPDNRADRADVYLLRSTDGGSNWSAPRRLSDDTGIAEQMLPSVAVTDDGAVGASWYDRRNDPVNLSLLDIYATVSTDGGATFLPNRRITT
ncbi:MAG: sialidase family protein, partial [Candidatus Bathyarchaeia archaeon]